MISHVNDKLKLNRFKDVAIPKNRDYFARFGFAKSPANSFSGDDLPPSNEDKIDSLVRGQNEFYKEYAKSREFGNE